MDDITYQFEYDRHIPIAFIGAGGHAYRNIYPALQYAPVDLRAVCDLDASRADRYARMFGAAASYTDYREMLVRERPTAVLIVTGYTPDGGVQATTLAEECLRAGAHVWMEKPTAASLAEVNRLEAAATAADRYVMTGLKKVFTPAMEKVKAIISSAEFGRASSIFVRYPQILPSPQRRTDPRAMVGVLDHLYHPAAILHYLMGPVQRFCYEWESWTGGSTATVRFSSGAVGTLHLAAGSAATSPLERVEVIGDGTNVVVENGVRVTYYRRAAPLPYGRTGSYIVDDEAAPLVWEPEMSLGQLYNKNLFFLGYVPEVLHFCSSVLDGVPPQRGTLTDSRAIMRLYEAYRDVASGTVVEFPVDGPSVETNDREEESNGQPGVGASSIRKP